MLREGSRNGVSSSKERYDTHCPIGEPEKVIVAEGGVIMGVEEVLEAKLEDHEKAFVMPPRSGTPRLCRDALCVKGMVPSSSHPVLL